MSDAAEVDPVGAADGPLLDDGEQVGVGLGPSQDPFEDVDPTDQEPDFDEPEADNDVDLPGDGDDLDASYGPLESVIREPRAALLPLIVCFTLAVVLGIVRPPVYTAQAQLVVGGVVRDYTPAAGQTEAVKDLTDIYSRLVGSSSYLDRVDQALGSPVPPGVLSAAPIPNSPLIRLEATGSSAEEAVARANAGSHALTDEVADLKNEASQRDQKLLAAVDAQSADVDKKQADRDAKLASYTAAPSAAALDAYATANAALTSAQVQLQAVKDDYSASASARSSGIDLVSFSEADAAASNRTKSLSLYGFAGLVIGGLLGMALATLVANHWRLLPRDRRSSIS